MRRHIYAAAFVAIAFTFALLWAKARDPFERAEFSLRTPHGKVKGMAVMPKPSGPHPVAVYLHGSGGSLWKNGREMLQLAELDMAAVSFEYCQTNQAVFDAQFIALQEYLERQSWARKGATAWIGFSLGAQRTLEFALEHPNRQPELMVRLAGGWVESAKIQGLSGMETSNFNPRTAEWDGFSSIRSWVLLVHGENDGIFPVADCRRLAQTLRNQGVQVECQILPAQTHDFAGDRSVVMRAIAEYCAAFFQAQTRAYTNRIPPNWHYLLPAFLVMGLFLAHGWRRLLSIARAAGPLTPFSRVLSVVAWVMALAAAGLTTFHLVLPRLRVTPGVVEIAGRWLVREALRADFQYLAGLPVWENHRLRAMLEHAELPNFRGPFLYENMERRMFHEFIVSPVVDEASLGELNWRRPLWENFYPRVRHEKNPIHAAEIVVSFLRQRVGIDLAHGENAGVETIWVEQVTDEAGFERIYVAALRAAGAAARLGGEGTAELWTGKQWQPAPRPLVTHWPLKTEPF